MLFSCTVEISSNGGESSSSENNDNNQTSEQNTPEPVVLDYMQGKRNFLVLLNNSSADVSFDTIRNANSPSSSYTSRRSAVRQENSEDFIKQIIQSDNSQKIIDGNISDPEIVKLLGTNKKQQNSRFAVNAVVINNNSSTTAPVVGDTKNFWVFDSKDSSGNPIENNSQQYPFTLKAIGSKCLIWFHTPTIAVQGLPEPSINISESSNPFQDLANNLDSVFDKEMAIFGSNVINQFGDEIISAPAGTKLNVLIYDICGDGSISNQGAFLGGLFSSKDIFLQSYLGTLAKSNECECIYADSYLFKNDIDNNKKSITSTLLHEFQHLLHFINKTIKIAELTNEGVISQTWFNEMMSMCAEDIFQSQLGLADADSPKNRMSTFNAYHYIGFRTWRSGDDVLISYANSYAFGAYLMRNYGGIQLINKLATNNYVDESAITDALHECGYANENFESVLKKFANVCINLENNTNTSNISLNKSISQSFGNTTYNITGINLLNYYNTVANNLLPAFYDYQNRNQPISGTNNSKIYGPVILSQGLYFTSQIGPTGYFISYLGVLESNPSFYPVSGITPYVIWRD